MFKRLILFVCIFVIAPAAVNGAILLDKVVAIVNKEVITWSDLYGAMEFEASDAMKAMDDKERRRFFKESEPLFLEKLIDMRLQLQEAAKSGISANDEDVEKAVKSIKDKYSMTDEMLKEALKKEGSSFSEYRKRLSEQIIISRVIDQEVRSKVVVTEEEVEKHISENKNLKKENEGFGISHIFLKKTGEKARIEERTNDIYRQIREGADFSELAKKYSEDASAKTGGDLGFIKKADVSTEFMKALSGMKPGDVSEPFWSDRGMHILKVNEIRMFENPKEFKEAIKQKLLDEKLDKEYRSWLKGLREKSYIEIKLMRG